MKGFRQQHKECKANGNLVEDGCPKCGQVLLICKKYGKQCKSGLCLKDREYQAELDKVFKTFENIKLDISK